MPLQEALQGAHGIFCTCLCWFIVVMASVLCMPNVGIDHRDAASQIRSPTRYTMLCATQTASVAISTALECVHSLAKFHTDVNWTLLVAEDGDIYNVNMTGWLRGSFDASSYDFYLKPEHDFKSQQWTTKLSPQSYHKRGDRRFGLRPQLVLPDLLRIVFDPSSTSMLYTCWGHFVKVRNDQPFSMQALRRITTDSEASGRLSKASSQTADGQAASSAPEPGRTSQSLMCPPLESTSSVWVSKAGNVPGFTLTG